jgi:hypothetical protein
METGMLDEVYKLRSVGEAFLQALANRDFGAQQACMQPEINFRALVPPGIRQASDAEGTVNRLRLWFGEADSFEVLHAEIGQVANRLSITYRIRLHDSDGWQTIEQRLYCDVGEDGRIRNLDLLCSGFLPERPAPPIADRERHSRDPNRITRRPSARR